MRWKALLILPALLLLGSVPATAAEPESRAFILDVTSAQPGQEQTFRAAIGHGGRIEFITAKTPFKKELTAHSLTFMFEVTQGDGHVRAQLHGERNGALTLFGDISGKSGKITDEPWSDCAKLSFGPF